MKTIQFDKLFVIDSLNQYLSEPLGRVEFLISSLWGFIHFVCINANTPLTCVEEVSEAIPSLVVVFLILDSPNSAIQILSNSFSSQYLQGGCYRKHPLQTHLKSQDLNVMFLTIFLDV